MGPPHPFDHMRCSCNLERQCCLRQRPHKRCGADGEEAALPPPLRLQCRVPRDVRGSSPGFPPSISTLFLQSLAGSPPSTRFPPRRTSKWSSLMPKQQCHLSGAICVLLNDGLPASGTLHGGTLHATATPEPWRQKSPCLSLRPVRRGNPTAEKEPQNSRSASGPSRKIKFVRTLGWKRSMALDGKRMVFPGALTRSKARNTRA